MLDTILNWIFILSAPIYIVMFVCCIYRNLQISSAIIEAGCDAFGDIPSSIFVPFLTLILMLANASLWIFIMMSVMAEHVHGHIDNSVYPLLEMTEAASWWIA